MYVTRLEIAEVNQVMKNARRLTSALLVLALGTVSQLTLGQDVTYEERDGVRYQVTRRIAQRQVPVTVMQDRQQTVYTQQVTTNHVNHQQLYCVPVTQYQLVSRMRGRWNPFVTPYWTHNMQPVTTWHQQVANVQIPVSRVAWVPQTTTTQVPVTAYRTAEEEIVTRVAMDKPRSLASAQPLSSSRPVTIAARSSTSTPLGGVALENDPPRQATGWQSPPSSRYR